jgi:hypothetical protein
MGRPPERLSLSLDGGGMREDIAKFVNDFLPDLIFQQLIIAGGSQHPGL